MKTITIYSKVNGTHQIFLDDEDYEQIAIYKWFIYCCTFKGKRARTFYAVAHIKGKTVRMHRLIMNVTNPKILVDHRDNNSLNNQKSNLRTATAQQNQFNMRPSLKNKTGFKGVSFHKGDKKFMVFLQVCGKNKYFGSFDTPIEAAHRCNEIAMKHHGEFANLNPVTAIKYHDGTMYTHEVKTGHIVEQIRTFIRK